MLKFGESSRPRFLSGGSGPKQLMGVFHSQLIQIQMTAIALIFIMAQAKPFWANPGLRNGVFTRASIILPSLLGVSREFDIGRVLDAFRRGRRARCLLPFRISLLCCGSYAVMEIEDNLVYLEIATFVRFGSVISRLWSTLCKEATFFATFHWILISRPITFFFVQIPPFQGM
jgi:hypothetical protein